MDPSAPGLSLHRLERIKDPNFWSARVNADIRIIVHRTPSSILLAYVDHHDDAYKWAERRKIEQHPTTGAMQLVEVRELVQEVEIYRQPEPSQPKSIAEPPLFGNLRKPEVTGKRDFDQLCAEFGINRRLSPPAHTQTDDMVQRFKGRVEEALQSPHFQWGQDLETTLHRYVPL